METIEGGAETTTTLLIDVVWQKSVGELMFKGEEASEAHSLST